MDKKIIIAVAVAALAFPCGLCVGVGIGSWGPWRGGGAAAETKGGAVTLRHFQEIKRGMQYGEVVAMIGKEGKDVSREPWQKIVIWTNPDGSNLTCDFNMTTMEGLMTKEQNGLK